MGKTSCTGKLLHPEVRSRGRGQEQLKSSLGGIPGQEFKCGALAALRVSCPWGSTPGSCLVSAIGIRRIEARHS